MSKVMSVRETGALIERVRAAAGRLGEEYARVEKEGRQRQGAMEKAMGAELKRTGEDREAGRRQAATEHESALARLEAHSERRTARIEQAHANSRKQAADRIDEREGRRKFAVQKGILETERFRDQRAAELDQQLKVFQEGAAEERARLAGWREAARRSLRAYPWLYRPPEVSGMASGPSEDPEPVLGQVQQLETQIADELKRLHQRVLPQTFRFLPIWLIWLAAVALFIAGPARLGLADVTPARFLQILGASAGGATLLYLVGWGLASGLARKISDDLQRAEKWIEESSASAEARHQREREVLRTETRTRLAAYQQEWDAAIADAAAAREEMEPGMKERFKQALQHNERTVQRARSDAEERFRAAQAGFDSSGQASEAGRRAEWERKLSQLEREHARQIEAIKTEWRGIVETAGNDVKKLRAFAEAHFPPWDSAAYEPPQAPLNAVKFGEAEVKIAAPFESGEGWNATAPLMLTFPGEGSLFIEGPENQEGAAAESLNNIVYRILQTVPAGKAAFTLIDPIRLGQSFSSIMHLADFEENIVNRRIWTEPGEIEERLLELNAHMEKVIQMYLRNEFSDIAEYNKEAGRIAEKYHFLVIADFPANFSETALRRLQKIVSSGGRCGVFTLILRRTEQEWLPGFERKDFTGNAVEVQWTNGGVTVPALGAGVTVRLDEPPEAELATQFLQAVGEASRGSNTVRVPFEQIAPDSAHIWSLDTTEELRVPIGRSGASKLQYFSLGKGTRQHVLIAGKTGSGKSTLLHVLVTNLALWASPDQVEFYLVDFKKGVEFKDYATAKLPHARVVAIESDREFGLSVLRRVDEELRRRGELFRTAGAQDLASYKRAAKEAKLPRVLLVIDEFQELFVQDDGISQNAALLLDRIVRQGRAFGIHVVLGSQTLGGAYSLARSTLGQMVVRIALQCNEADAYLIMDESNPAPRLLSRPGEGIYNDSGGRPEGNSPFQVVWLPESERREALRLVRNRAEEQGIEKEPVVFEGNTLAELSANAELLAAPAAADRTKIWLGLPNEIKGPTQVILDARTGRNLLIASQQDDHARALLGAAMIAVAAQHRESSARLILLERPASGPHLSLSGIATELPIKTEIPGSAELPAVLRQLAQDLEAREGGQSGVPVFLIIHNLSGFKALRPEDEFSISLEDNQATPAADFQRIYAEGPVHGMHVIAHVDSFGNANRFLGRKGLKEFGLRVLFQMSASDSASFSDDPRAGNLGLNRALLYDEQEGTYEMFRPYARPNEPWISGFLKDLGSRVGAAS